jgi:hypothetical protein
MIGIGVALRHGIQTKADFKGSGDGRMVIDTVINQVARNAWRDDDDRNTRSVLLECELMLV